MDGEAASSVGHDCDCSLVLNPAVALPQHKTGHSIFKTFIPSKYFICPTFFFFDKIKQEIENQEKTYLL